MHLAGLAHPQALEEAHAILLPMGEYFQVRYQQMSIDVIIYLMSINIVNLLISKDISL
jgi:hypothetical protein